MSTLKAARADNFYQPPDWDPQRESRNAYQASGKAEWQAHPLRERAKKLRTEGVLVVRFEMPFNIWCGSCSAHIAQGVRFNAEKKCVGKYHSTKIWAFGLKCHLCAGAIEVRTDPRKGDFEVTAGARRKQEGYAEADAEVERLDAPEERARRAADPLYALEHRESAHRRAKAAGTWLERLQQQRDERWGPGADYERSSQLRARLREDKRASRRAELELRARGVGVVSALPPPTAADEQAARAHEFAGAKRRRSEAECGLPAARIQLGGIFDDPRGGSARAEASGARGPASARRPAASTELERRLQLLRQRKARGMQVRTH